MSGLEIKNLYVSVHEKQIIENFSLTVPKGEIHAITGPNGTGKIEMDLHIENMAGETAGVLRDLLASRSLKARAKQLLKGKKNG